MLTHWSLSYVKQQKEAFLNWAFGTTKIVSPHGCMVRWNRLHGHLLRIDYSDDCIDAVSRMQRFYSHSIKKTIYKKEKK